MCVCHLQCVSLWHGCLFCRVGFSPEINAINVTKWTNWNCMNDQMRAQTQSQIFLKLNLSMKIISSLLTMAERLLLRELNYLHCRFMVVTTILYNGISLWISIRHFTIEFSGAYISKLIHIILMASDVTLQSKRHKTSQNTTKSNPNYPSFVYWWQWCNHNTK